jgi:hypothetical protein
MLPRAQEFRSCWNRAVARSGNYEVDPEGNLVEVQGDEAALDRSHGPSPPTPAPVRRALRVYGLAQVISFALLIVAAITKPEIRPLLLMLAVIYAVVAFGLHRLYRRALMRRFASRRGQPRA